MDEKGIVFLDKLYGNLYMSDVVQHTKENTDSRIDAIRKYLERLENLHKFADTEKRKEYVLNMYFDKYVIKEENIPFGQENEQIIEAQKKKLSMWISYLTDPTTNYTTWAKYWAFQGMLKMGSYDEFTGAYSKRNKSTIAPFVDPNPEILAKSITTIMKLVNNEEPDELTEERLNKTDSFSKIYTMFEKKLKQNIRENTVSTDGIWIKYNQGSKEDAIRLSKSLENKNTGWCTSDESTAISQVCGYQGREEEFDYGRGGDFYVYYTKDTDGKYTLPRIAIRLEGKNKIGEIRGIKEGQNLEEELVGVLENKLKEMDFLNKDSVNKAFETVKDLMELTEITKKIRNNTTLNDEELNNIYSKKYGFGWTQDPRVEKILKTRNVANDFERLPIDTRKKLLGSNVLPKTLKIDDEELLRDAIKFDTGVLIYASERLLDKKDFILYTFSRKGFERNLWLRNYQIISKRLLDDEDVAMLIVKNNPLSLQFVSDRLRNDKKVVTEAIKEKQNVLVQNSKEAFEFASDNLKDDKDYVLDMNNNYNIPLLQYVSERLKDDKELVLETVKKDGEQLQFASDRLRDNEEVVITTIRGNNRRFLRFASYRLKDDKDFILKLFKEENMAGVNFTDVSDRLKDDRDVAICALHNAGRNIDFVFKRVSPRLQQDPMIKITAAKINEDLRKQSVIYSYENITSTLREIGQENNKKTSI